MPSISKMYSGEYLKCTDLNGQDVKLTIDSADERKFENERPKVVLQFRGTEKKFALNKTNANSIGRFCGDNYDVWPGNEIVLYPAKVDFQGKLVDAIRVKEPPRSGAASAPKIDEPPSDPIPF